MPTEYQDFVMMGVRTLIQNAQKCAKHYGHDQVGIYHYLLAAVERNGGLIKNEINDVTTLTKTLKQALAEGNFGATVDLSQLLDEAYQYAKENGSDCVFESHYIKILIRYYRQNPIQPTDTENANQSRSDTNSPQKPKYKMKKENQVANASTTPTSVGTNHPLNTVLLRYGENLTSKALAGEFQRFTGRELEIKRLARILLHQRKRNPLIVGPAGVGKTELVRGFAHFLTTDEAPIALKNYQIYQIYTSSILSNASLLGEIEGRMEAILREAKKPNIILFIDELHMLIGAGSQRNLDLSNILKPALADDDILVIGATTDDEYNRYIQPDKAFERRFHILRLHSLDKAGTIQVMKRFSEQHYSEGPFAIEIQDDIFEKLYDYADIYLQDRSFPDKALDLLEESVSYALSNNQKKLTVDLAAQASKEFIGMPVQMAHQVEKLREKLNELKILKEDDLNKIINRLSATIERYDLQPNEPNLSVIFYSEAKDLADIFCEVVAETLFENRDRVITIDLSQLTEPNSLSQLIGSPHGYVGFDSTLPLHQVIQNPWCVIKFTDIDHAHPKIVHLISDALIEGYFTLANNQKIILSEAIVVLTMSNIEIEVKKQYGFRKNLATEEEFYIVQPFLLELAQLGVDHVVGSVPKEWQTSEWIKNRFLSTINQKMALRNFYLEWDETVIEWILKKGKHPNIWKDLFDEEILPKILQVKKSNPNLSKYKLRIVLENDVLKVQLKEDGCTQGVGADEPNQGP
ncbi:MAG: AAA family ATPase [bacterium]|nr:AAA family ATPase [bacterium]